MDLVSDVFLFLRRNLLLGKRLNIFTSAADEDGIEPAAGIDGFRFSFLSFFFCQFEVYCSFHMFAHRGHFLVLLVSLLMPKNKHF